MRLCLMSRKAAGLEGYYAGKVSAEAAVTRYFGGRGLILRPGAIYGTRMVSPNISIPIGLVGAPLTMVFETPPVRNRDVAI
jgi:nucleoside-diphosphate-sugar epimerase